MALTSDRDTVRRNGDETMFEAASTVYAGSMVCLNSSGKLVPASITAGLSPVVGVAQRQGKSGEKVLVRRGVHAFDAASADAPTLASIGTACYAADDCTVQKTTATNAPMAGIVLDVTNDGVWVKI
ncbi:MAG: hypothetical protein RR317_01970 [Bilophila sp.]